jgi:hypothetical protein
MPRADFNLGNEVSIDLVGPNGLLIDLGGLVEFRRDPVTKMEQSAPLTDAGRTINRTIPQGWEGSFKFDRQSNAMDTIQQQMETNYFAGGRQIYFNITETLRDPKTGAMNQYQYEECCVWMKGGGDFKSDSKVTQTMEFKASRRTQLL